MHKGYLWKFIEIIKAAERKVVYNASVSEMNRPTVTRPSDLQDSADTELTRAQLQNEFEKLDLIESEIGIKPMTKVG